jgi:pyruvate/2-oxoglutarate dehydrogenase complex dihydrolipoamide acyltransferase (E2) component
MPDIVTIVDLQGRESIPIVGTLIIDPVLGDHVRAAQDTYYIRPQYILRHRHVEPEEEQATDPTAPAAMPEEAPAEPAWEIDPQQPYAHLSPSTRRMLEERDKRIAAEQAPIAPSEITPEAPVKRKRGRPRKNAI